MSEKMKVLIVIDAQNDFIDGPLGTPEAQSAVPKIVEKIKNADDDTLILFTKDTHDNEYLETQEGKNLPIKHCVDGTNGWNIEKEIRSAWIGKENKLSLGKSDNNTFYKHTFGSNELVCFLKLAESDICEFEIVGFCTDICVISNALLLKTHFPEIPLLVDSLCCAGTTPENHQKALDIMKICQIEIK